MDLKTSLEKLSLKDGDVLIVKGNAPRDLVTQLVHVGQMDPFKTMRIPIVILGDGELEKLDEAAMGRAGWVRAPRGV